MDAAKELANYFELDLKSVVSKINKDYNLLDIIEDFKIDLRHTYHQETLLVCRHATTSNDNLESIRKKGLLNLKRILEEETPLSQFLFSPSLFVSSRCMG